MSESLIIPSALQGAFHHLMNCIIPENRNDPSIQESILVYLKLGGVSGPSLQRNFQKEISGSDHYSEKTVS